MTYVLITTENLATFKKSYANISPLIKSSHLTEATARGLGFLSNAALRQSLKIKQSKTPQYITFNERKFHDFLLRKAPNVTHPSPKSLFQSLPLPLFKYINSANLNKTVQKNAWFYTCRKNNTPFVYIEKQRKYYSVHWDYISVDEHHNPKKFTEKDAISIKNLAHQYGGKKMKYEFSVLVGDIENIDSLNSAEILAYEIFKILHNLIE